LHLNHFSVSNLSGPNALRAGSFGSRPGREKAANSTRNQNPCQAKSIGDQPLVSWCANLRGARLLDQFGDPPCLGPRDRAALLDHDQITLAALVFLVVGVVFLR